MKCGRHFFDNEEVFFSKFGRKCDSVLVLFKADLFSLTEEEEEEEDNNRGLLENREGDEKLPLFSISTFRD